MNAQTPILTASLLIIFTSQVAHAQPPRSIKDLERQYDNIFKTGNRNAASHLWSSYISKQSQDLNASTLEHLFTGFCPVSGSPLPDTPQHRLRRDAPEGRRRVSDRSGPPLLLALFL
uniref:Uncharacterized protein n=1 Tax=Alexandrium monilatum TaxID=311494 RepID=A0A7S4VEP7_9DINO